MERKGRGQEQSHKKCGQLKIEENQLNIGNLIQEICYPSDESVKKLNGQ